MARQNIILYEAVKGDVQMKQQPFIFCISGAKNSGKTTLITKIIPVLRAKGLKVATIKHDGHDFDADVPGTDTDRHWNAGAYGTAIFSENKYMLIKREKNVAAGQLAAFFPEADIILVEGMKHGAYPKIEIIRENNSNRMACGNGHIVGVASDFQPDLPKGVPLFDLNDPAALAEAILDCQFIQTKLSMIILSGGLSRRMGRDKADLYYKSASFLEYQIEKGRLLGIKDILVSGYGGGHCSGRIVPDRYKGCGPLGGLEACMREACGEASLVLSVDVPCVPAEVLKGLISECRKNRGKTTILKHRGKQEPLIAVYENNLADQIEEGLKKGNRRVKAFLGQIECHTYESNADERMFENINTPEEYEIIQRKE